MTATSGFAQSVTRADAFLLDVSKPVQYLAIALTMVAMVYQCLPHVPRQYVDYSHVPLLSNIAQPPAFGSDTVADMYESKVILNDPGDMYTKQKLDQAPEEAAYWSKAASAPYPPAVLWAEAGLYALGRWTGLQFYGLILMLACVFVGWSARYFLQTRWYLFPLLYLNFSYFGYRFVYVQDGSYLVMLVVIMAALVLARARNSASHALMAVAITMKLSPLYYLKNISGMSRRTALLFAAILLAGLVLPYFIWDNYLYIYQFQEGIKGGRSELASAIIIGGLFSVLLWYVETRLGFDMEDRVGWGLVPVALFLALKMNVARHLLIVLLVPDKRGPRNVVAAVALALPVLFPAYVRFGSSLAIATVLLFGTLVWYLGRVGWRTVMDDLRHPGRTVRMMLSTAG